MALTPSNMMPLGTIAPDFTLPDAVSGKDLNLQDLKSDKGTVIMFVCNHCPFVKHLNAGISQMAKDYQQKGLEFIAICSNDVENYPEDSADKLKQQAIDNDFAFPYLIDESQDVAKSYQAACTPDFYIFDGDLKCVYRGQFDSSRPGNNVPVTGEDMRNAMDAMLKGDAISPNQKPSQGCNIKWKI